MNINDKHIKQINQLYKNYINTFVLQKNSKFHYTRSNDQNAYKLLEKEILKIKGLKDIISGFAVYLFIGERLDSFVNDDKVDKKIDDNNLTKLSELLSSEEIEKETSVLIDWLKSFPRKYDIYISFPIDIPENIEEIIITSDISILQIKDLNKYPNYLRENLINPPLSQLIIDPENRPILRKDYVYLKIQSSGYAGGNIADSAIRRAFSIMKQFLYIGWCEPVNKSFNSLNNDPLFSFRFWATRRQTMNSFFVDHIDKKPTKIFVPEQINKFLQKVRLGSNAFEGSVWYPNGKTILGNSKEAETFEEKISVFLNDSMRFTKNFLEAKNHEILTPVNAAIEWGFESMSNENETFSYIQACIGIEAVIAVDEPDSVTSRLKEACAFMLGTNREDRKKISEDFSEIYKQRSKLVHGKSTHLSEGDKKLLYLAQDLLKRIIHKEVSNSLEYIKSEEKAKTRIK